MTPSTKIDSDVHDEQPKDVTPSPKPDSDARDVHGNEEELPSHFLSKTDAPITINTPIKHDALCEAVSKRKS